MIELQKETIVLWRDRTTNAIQMSNTIKTGCPVIEPNTLDNDWVFFLDAWIWYKEMCKLTNPVEMCNKLRTTCSPEMLIQLFGESKRVIMWKN